MRRLLLALVVVSGIGALVPLFSDALMAQPTENGIFEPLAQPADDAPLAARERRARLVRFDRARVFTTPAGQPDAALTGEPLLTLNLFPDVTVNASFERVERGTPGFFTWMGTPTDWEHGIVSLTFGEGVIDGLVQTQSRIYVIRTVGSGVARIVEIDTRDQRPDGDPLFVSPDGVAPAAEGRLDSADQIDVLVVYTRAVRRDLGGGSQLTGWVNSQIAITNRAYADSGITQRVRLVGIRDLQQAGSGNMSTDMPRLYTVDDGFFDEVHAVREAVRADLVAMVVDRDRGACGLAPGMQAGQNNTAFAPFGFSISVQNCDTQFSFTHELAHNMGANHAPEDSGIAPSPLYPYAFGLKDAFAAFRTVMAYECPDVNFQCPRIARFSHATLRYNNRAQGSSTQHNAGVLNNSAASVANFRTNSPGVLPGIPPTPRIELDANNLLTVRWEAPLTGGTPTGYLLEAGNGEGLTNLAQLPLGPVNELRATVARGRYWLRIRALNAQGYGAPSDDRYFEVGDLEPPNPPTGFSATVNGNEVTFAWTAPSQPPRVAGYVVEAGVGSGSAAFRLPVNATSLRATGPDGTFHARVRATNDAGQSAPSNEVSFRLGIELPGAPSGLTAAIRQSNVVLAWGAPASGGPVEGYMISAGSSAGASNILSNLRIGNVLGYSANAPNGRYHVRVRAFNRAGVGPESNEAVVIPDSAICTGDVSATLTWNGTGDLDLHVYEPNGTHVYYGNQRGTTARLDRDNTSGYGPENICVNAGTALAGFYEVVVVGFGGFTSPRTATITVRVKANTPQEQYQVFTRTIPVPPNSRLGHKVAAVDGRGAQIVNHTGTRSVDQRGVLDEKPK